MIQFQRSLMRVVTCLSLAGLVPLGCAEATTTPEATTPEATTPEERQAPQSQPTAVNSTADSSRFIRFVDEGGGEGRLETAIVTYLGPQGQRLDLVSAVHVADRVYYDKLQALFEDYDSLRYEMVKPKHMQPQGNNRRRQGLISFFQRGLKNVLKLEFQLDGLDYLRPNFVHADLDAETFTKLSKDRETVDKLQDVAELTEALAQADDGPVETGAEPVGVDGPSEPDEAEKTQKPKRATKPKLVNRRGAA